MRGSESISSFDHERSRFEQDVLRGLAAWPRSLPCKYFYDERGSRLFDRITTLHEYYPTRAETSLLQEHAREIATNDRSACSKCCRAPSMWSAMNEQPGQIWSLPGVSMK